MKLDFENEPPENNNFYEQHFFKKKENSIEIEIKVLFSKRIIEKYEHEIGEYISPTFTQLKPDGSNRLLLNLKKINHEMLHIYFKMETLQSVLEFVTPGCFMASLDLKDAYYSIPTNPDHTKYLKFFGTHNYIYD